MRQKVDYIEPDICLTSDGVPICMHDFELSGTTDVAEHPEFADKRTSITLASGTYTGWFTNNFTLAQMKTLRVKQRLPNRDKYYDGLFRVPTLNETIQLVKTMNKKLGLDVGVYIEPKHPAYFESMALKYDDRLLEVLEWNGMVVKRVEGGEQKLSKVIIECFESTQLKRLRPRMDLPFVQLIKEPWEPADDNGQLYVHMMSAEGLGEIAAYANAIGPIKSYFEPQNASFVAKTNPDTLIGGAAVDEAHRLGLLIHPWTLRNSWEDPYIQAYFDGSEEKQLRYLYDLGIDGIFTESAAAAYYVRQDYEQSFVRATPPPEHSNHQASAALPLMVVIPILCAAFALLVGMAIGRYFIPLATPNQTKQESLSLLDNSVQ